MDIEQLKLILETVKGAGDAALTIVGVALGKDLLLSLVGYSALFYGIKSAASVITILIHDNAFKARLMEEIDTSVYLTPAEENRLIELIRKGKAKA